MTPVSGWGQVFVTDYEDWDAADAAYEKYVSQSLTGRGTHVVRLIPYRTALRDRALLDELLALDDFDVLGSAREFRPLR